MYSSRSLLNSVICKSPYGRSYSSSSFLVIAKTPSMLCLLKPLLVLMTLFAVDVTIASRCQHPFTCGDIFINSDHPFGVKGHPKNCGESSEQLACEHNRAVMYLGSSSNKYYIVRVSTRAHVVTLAVLDPVLQKGNCSTIPLQSSISGYFPPDAQIIIFVGCEKRVESPLYIDTTPCVTANEFSNRTSTDRSYSYVVFDKAMELKVSDIEETCTIYRTLVSWFPSLNFSSSERNISFRDIHNAMAMGFEIYYTYDQQSLATLVALSIASVGEMLPMAIAARAIIGSILLCSFLIYKCRRRHLSLYDDIEDFLQNRNNMVPIRYSYRQIKKMTNNFKEKLGEGGFGAVYKGKLRSGQLVAVKMLTKSKANGRDFINEVDTLGRIHHVNVVRLVGFCATTSKNALIYDYMPNGSLDKFIFSGSVTDTKLDWSNVHEIAMGVARGIEYLHQGCNMQILHFDIKPHNILLDENFVPKVSDFGLAKLRPVKNNVVTMTAVRGTLGYMAPELFYRRVGEVSYKADVYSFGMLLLELAGRRSNVNANAEHSSQLYFPSWIYDQFHHGNGVVQLGDGLTEEEKGIAIKLILIALWCIQMTPNDRPSMIEVLAMLQGDGKDIQLPSKPQFYPADEPVELEQTSIHSSFEESFQSQCGSVSLGIEHY